MSISSIQSQSLAPATYVQNEIGNSRYEPKQYSEFNSLDRIYVDSPVISKLNLEKQHVDMPEKIQTKQTKDLQQKDDPFKEVDFAAESKDFEPAQLKQIEGDVKLSQANAKQQRVEELLSDSK